MKFLTGSVSIFFFTVMLPGCFTTDKNLVTEIKVGLHNNNQLKIQLDILTNSKADVWAEYWPDSIGADTKFLSPVSKDTDSHSLVLCNIIPQTNYSYHILTEKDGVKDVGKTYTFTSPALPMWMQDQFKASNSFQDLIPKEFKNGLMLVNKRDAPGITYLVDYKGRIRWYHIMDGEGVKVTHFTKDRTIISILGTNDEPTSYGSQVLEINLMGDTVLYLKKGQGDFKQTIHHEILKNDRRELATLFVDKKIMDLRSIGGKEKDTITGDGILIMDTTGRKIWQWSVFDVMDPLKDPALLTTKKDWMHANSLNYDKDSNYLISFYNKGQIWKVDAHTGKVMWKIGKGGDVAMPADCDFAESHAVHIDPWGNLMFFDNGVEKHQSGVYALKLNEEKKTSEVSLHFLLPKEVYNGRMGSAYMINDTSVLCCCSKRHITVLANRKGVLQWTMETAIPTYRVEFIKAGELKPYLVP
ncbi:MAG: aryl-sulfate sulfotransferase [Ginsengibacter sp.]